MLGILVILLVFSLLMRFERGLLGIILTATIGLLGFYWFRELRKAVLSYKVHEKLPFELIEEGDMIVITAQVPGPESEVSLKVRGRKLFVKGGKGFKKGVKLPYPAVLLSSSYINGVLHAKLLRRRALSRSSPIND